MLSVIKCYKMIDQKRQIILQKAAELIRKFGIRGVTMDEIALQAGVSKKTIYQYFKDKKDLVKQIIFWELDKTENQIRQILGRQDLNSIDKSLEVHRLILDMHRKHPPVIEHDLRRLYTDIFQEVRNFVKRRMYTAVIENLESGKREGLIRSDLNSEIIAAIQITRYEAIRMSADILENYTLEQILKEIIKYHLYGICSEKGRQYLKTLNL